ncbi:MAG: D-cysteine desulfhydrase family protein [Candidatus Rokubacteria bacterium]|nr:D-cysteine desulfhydrase family protein [Candidatus Rokubacteria bacterium]
MKPLPPREPLGFFPTPLHPLPRLAAHLGGPRLWIKRDDLTGFALGGNKVRKLEFFLGEARAIGADILLTAGGHQSNHARVTAAAAARAGLDCLLVLSGGRPVSDTGNLALDRLFGAAVRFVETGPERMPVLHALADELRAAGRRPLVIPIGGSTPLGALGYVEAAREAAGQFETLGVTPVAVVHGSSSGGTQAGLVVGCRTAGLGTRVIGASADETRADLTRMIADIVGPLSELIGVPAPPADAIEVLDDYVGEGYGIPTGASEEATRLFARLEGIPLDPTYSAKAAAGLLDLIRRGAFGPDDVVCFWHTGGMAWHRPAP